ncbi:MAG TPA: formyltetrahydrofolate deformylase [Phnomibacter sp.]|nr:formyltetrahydrofolate deformylase [Phnomibacter sp.]
MTSILLIQCADRIGLVATLARTMAEAENNIVSMREHVDGENDMFFCRIELQGPPLQAGLIGRLKTLLPYGALVTYDPNRIKRTVLLVTREHHCLGDLLIRNHFRTLPIDIQAVIGNHEVLADITNKFNIPFHYISHEGKSKGEFEQEILERLETYQPDLLVLAKFMRILSPSFVASYPHGIINIHHSFLPAFIGANPYRQAYERGVKLIGATAHFVTNDLDEGPIISQQIIPVDHSYNAGEMARAGKEVEQAVLARAVRLVAEDRVLVWGNKTVVFE